MIDTLKDWLLWIPAWFWITIVVHFTVLGTVAYLILLERKVASWVQDRIGPNRVGFDFGLPFLGFLKGMNGLGQPLADGLKFIFKEDYRPGGVDKILFTLAPGVMILTIIISIAVVPWGGIKQTTRAIDLGVNDTTAPIPADQLRAAAQKKIAPGEVVYGTPTPADQPGVYNVTYRYSFQIADLDIGVLFILATLSLAVYGVVIGGWASNNKYSFLGGLRATANMISYEVPLGLAVLTIVLMYGTLDLGTIVEKQAWMWHGIIPAWNVFTQPLAFLMFLVCIHAEANRAPFDLAEAEQELVGGYHTEYSSMRFALFFLAEYAGMITTSAVCVALFFGGWHLPGLTDGTDPNNPAVTSHILLAIIRGVVFFGKTLAIIFVFMWVRWSLPRFRFDQLMGLAWRALIPMSLVILFATAIVIYFFGHDRALLRVGGRLAIPLLIMNVVVLALFFGASVLLPAPPPTNRRIRIPGSRFNPEPVTSAAVAATV
jgi:NADH-quinone oxidoreductase subunit H